MKIRVIIFTIVLFTFMGCGDDCEVVLGYVNRGCFNFMVFDTIEVSNLENSYVVIDVDRDKLDVGNKFQAFSIEDNPNISSRIVMFNKPGNNYCTDAIDADLEEVKTWDIQEGTVEIRIVREKSECDTSYDLVDVVLENAVYVDTDNNTVTIERKEFLNVRVNGFIG